MITIDHPKIVGYLKDKDILVKQGRALSKRIQQIETDIAKLDKKERAITEKVNPKDLIERGNALTEEINAKIKELEALGKQIEDLKIAAIPEKMKQKHYELRDEKEKKEQERNRVALKVQKIKDRVIPLIQKAVKPHLKEEFDDIESANVVGDVVKVTTFNHIEQFKQNFKKKQG